MLVLMKYYNIVMVNLLVNAMKRTGTEACPYLCVFML